MSSLSDLLNYLKMQKGDTCDIAIVTDIHGNLPALISVPYDHHAMAALAMARKRPDWAYALSSGSMTVGE